MSELKTKPTKLNAREYLSLHQDEQRRADCFLLIELMRAATGVEPLMWGASMVGFGKYKYAYESGREGEWPIIGFSSRKNDLTVYIMPGFENYGAMLEKLGKHKTGKSCLYLKRLSDVDQQVLAQIIDVSVKAMAKNRVE